MRGFMVVLPLLVIAIEAIVSPLAVAVGIVGLILLYALQLKHPNVEFPPDPRPRWMGCGECGLQDRAFIVDYHRPGPIECPKCHKISLYTAVKAPTTQPCLTKNPKTN